MVSNVVTLKFTLNFMPSRCELKNGTNKLKPVYMFILLKISHVISSLKKRIRTFLCPLNHGGGEKEAKSFVPTLEQRQV